MENIQFKPINQNAVIAVVLDREDQVFYGKATKKLRNISIAQPKPS